MKLKFNVLSFILLILFSIILGSILVNVSVAESMKTMLYMAIGFFWQSVYPIIDVEEIPKDNPNEPENKE